MYCVSDVVTRVVSISSGVDQNNVLYAITWTMIDGVKTAHTNTKEDGGTRAATMLISMDLTLKVSSGGLVLVKTSSVLK